MCVYETYKVERQRHKNYTQDSSKIIVALGGIRTHHTLQSRRLLYQMLYQNYALPNALPTELSAGRVSNLQHKANLKPLCYATVYSHSVCRSRPGCMDRWMVCMFWPAGACKLLWVTGWWVYIDTELIALERQICIPVCFHQYSSSIVWATMYVCMYVCLQKKKCASLELRMCI